MSPVALRIVNDVSYATGINHESDFTWPGQYSVTLDDVNSSSGVILCSTE